MLPVAVSKNVVDLVGALAWPIAVVAAVLLLRPLLPALVSRISKVSVANVTLELTASEVATQVLSSLSYLRDPASSVFPSSDAGQQLTGLVTGGQRADFATIDLGDGKRWLTSRLYIFSWVLAQVVGVRCLAFVETRDGIPHRFAGLAEPEAVRRSLGQRQMWLEGAFVAAHLDFYSPDATSAFTELKQVLSTRTRPLSELYSGEVEVPLRAMVGAAYGGTVGSLTPDQIASTYRNTQTVSRNVDENAPTPPGWVRLKAASDTPAGMAREEHAAWIRDGAHLKRLLGESLTYPAIVSDPTRTSRELQRQLILCDGGTFVALVDRNERLQRLHDRGRIVGEIGREAAEQGFIA